MEDNSEGERLQHLLNGVRENPTKKQPSGAGRGVRKQQDKEEEDPEDKDKEENKKADRSSIKYPPGCFIVALYQAVLWIRICCQIAVYTAILLKSSGK
jgi:hypothetical protein